MKLICIFVMLTINFVQFTKNIYVPKVDESLLNKVDCKPSIVGTPHFNKMEYSKNLLLENNLEEIWKDVPNYEGRYQVSTFGNVRSLNRFIVTSSHKKQSNGKLVFCKESCKKYIGKKLKVQIDNCGYVYTTFIINGKSKKHKVHRLIAKTFISNPENKLTVNHKNGIKTDNSIENLEWATSGENQKHAYKTGLKKALFANNNPTSKPVIQMDLNGTFIKKWNGLREIQRETGFLREAISRHCRGNKNYKHAYGFLWKFENKQYETN